jgi:hypothetical protein
MLHGRVQLAAAPVQLMKQKKAKAASAVGLRHSCYKMPQELLESDQVDFT